MTSPDPYARAREVAASVNRSQVARDTGINISHVSRIFSGQVLPSLPTACVIADYLGWTVDYLTWVLQARHPRHRRHGPLPDE